ncbi:putative membrane channel-forming protein YqfA (hemolysin III family) [Amphibacillus cookii]|nr:putative membrane channel-forming protein YqfA (hemolysin III family) [Amphibacillus cookii]
MKVKKLMWMSLFVELIVLIIIFTLLFMKRTIPDLLFGVFLMSMFVCILLSFFVRRATNKKESLGSNERL